MSIMRISAPGSEDAARPLTANGQPLQACSQAQERFWYEEQLQPGTSARNVFARWRLDGDVSTTILTEAWQAVIRHHEMLRASFVNVDGTPMQSIASEVDFVVREVDLTLLSGAAADDEADRIASVEAHTPFDIAEGPLVRVVHVRVRERVSVLMVTAHHIVCDGWSFGILSRDMGQAYAAIVERRPLKLAECGMTYVAHAAGENARLAAEPLSEELAAVRDRLEGFKRFEMLPDFPRPDVQTANGEIESILLDRALTDALIALSKTKRCTLFMTAYAALLVLLHRHSGEHDISMSTQVAGRDKVEIENVVGTFVNTIPLRNQLDPQATFDELLMDVRDSTSDAFESRHVPMGLLVDVVKPKRDLSRMSLFPTNFIFQRSFIENTSYGKLKLVDLPSRSAGSLYDLCFFMVERPEGWRVSCEFNTDLFERRTVAGLLSRFAVLLHGVLAAPGVRIADLPLLTEGDRSELARLRAAVRSDAHATVLDLFADQVARTPNAVAVACGGASLTYAALNLRSTQLAHELHRTAPGRGRAGVFLDRSIEAVVAMLAVLKSGNTYVALDPSLERTSDVIAATRPSVIVTRVAYADGLAPAGIPLVFLNAAPSADDGDRAALASVAPDDLASVTFAFPAELPPQGTQISHRALFNAVAAMRERPGVSARDTVLAITTFANDIASLDVFVSLASGAKLVIAKDRDIRDGAALNALARNTDATFVQATTETWRRLVDAGWAGNRGWRAICSAEPLNRELAEALLERVGALWTGYGFPETAAHCSVQPVERAAHAQRIAEPIPGAELYLLDANGNAVPPGACGELYVGGACLANGYLDDPALTENHFVTNLPAADGARLFRTGDRGRLRSDGHIELLERAEPRAPLDERRTDLDPPVDVVHTQPEHSERDDKTEHTVHSIVAELLGHDRFGREDDIFALGLHSLLAMRLIARLKKAYGVELPLRTLIEYPTVASLAQRIELLQDALHLLGLPEPIELVNAKGTKPPLFFFHGDVAADGLYSHRVASMMGADQPIYLVSPHGTAGLPLYASAEEMARDYYDRIRAVQPKGPYRVGGLCLGGLVAFELARMLRADGEVVDRVVLVNTGASPHRPLSWLDAMIRRIALDPSRPRNRREKLCYNLAWLNAILVSNPIQMVRIVMDRLNKMRHREPAWQGEAPPATDRDAQLALAYLDAAAFTYHAKPYAGDVTLIWAVDQAMNVRVPLREWRQVAANVRVVLIEGGHAPIYTNLEGFSTALTSALHG